MTSNAKYNLNAREHHTENGLIDLLLMLAAPTSHSELINLVHAVVVHPVVEQLVDSECSRFWQKHPSRFSSETDLAQQTYLGLIRQLLKRKIFFRHFGQTEFRCWLEQVVRRTMVRAWGECHPQNVSAIKTKAFRCKEIASKQRTSNSDQQLSVDLADCVAHIPNDGARRAMEALLRGLTITEAAAIHNWSRKRTWDLRQSGLAWLRSEWSGEGQ